MRAFGITLCSIFITITCMAVLADITASEVRPLHPQSVNLYRISIGSRADAAAADRIGMTALMAVRGGYLVLADDAQASAMQRAGISMEIIAPDVNRRQLGLDMRVERKRTDRYPVVFEEDGLRILRIGRDRALEVKESGGIAPIPARNLRIEYRDESASALIPALKALDVDLDSLIGCVSQDSLESYSYALQSFASRTPGSSASKGCKNWLLGKFLEFGYDSIITDTFTEESWWGEPITGINVIACKVGNLYPYDHIVIGAHRDAVGGSPGADDNGSGTAAVMEMARVLKDVETNMTIIFVLFDAEELGLLGAEAYAREAHERGDRITFMLNLDMIAFHRNYGEAYLYHGVSTEYAELWSYLADSLTGIGINGHLDGASGGSDHAAFAGYGYDVVFVHEYIFSTVYHSSRDSTTYMDFDYMTRMTMASLATACYTDGVFIPDPTLIMLPVGDFSPIIYPDSDATVSIQIIEYAGGTLVPGSVSLKYSINDGPMNTTPMTDLGGGFHEVTMPPMSCLDRINYSVMAGEQTTGQIVSYPTFGESLEAIKAAAVLVLLDDDFETDNGWTVEGNATSGHWDRWRAASNSAQPKTDFDGSGKCFLTDHTYAADVDDGYTKLFSPVLNIAHGEAIVEYARWFANDLGGFAYQDVFDVYFYNDQQPVPVETVGPLEQATGGWYAKRYRVSDFFESGDSLRLRFDASDLTYDSGVEAAVDAVRVILFSEAPYIITDTAHDGTVDMPFTLQLEASGCADPITWMDKFGDLDGSGLTLTADGMISGAVSDTGVVTFTAVAEDAVGVTSEREYMMHFWLPFVCGDANRDGSINVTDPVFVVNFIFKDGPEPYPSNVADANGDGDVNVGDAVALINYIFKGGESPVCE